LHLSLWDTFSVHAGRSAMVGMFVDWGEYAAASLLAPHRSDGCEMAMPLHRRDPTHRNYFRHFFWTILQH
jgi:hypothetical protein